MATRESKIETVTEMIVGKNGEKPTPSEVARYSYYVKKLMTERLLKQESGEFTLTDLGMLVARLVEIRGRVEGVSSGLTLR